LSDAARRGFSGSFRDLRDTIEQEQYWTYLTGVLEDLFRKATATLE